MLKSRRGDEEEGPGTVKGEGKMRVQLKRHTSHGRDAIRRLWVLKIRLEVGKGVVGEGGIHEGGAAGVLEESGIHGVVEMQR